MFGRQRPVSLRVSAFGHVLSPEIELGRERVVSGAMQGQVGSGVASVLAERSSVVELEAVRFPATYAALVDVAATSAVALENDSTHVGWHVSVAPARPQRFFRRLRDWRLRGCLVHARRHWRRIRGGTSICRF